jgi:hypothetical protein
MTHCLITVDIFSDSVNDVHNSSLPVNEIYIKEEPIDDAVASTSGEQHLLIETEEYIDIKDEPLTSDNTNSRPDLVSFMINKSVSNN